VSARVVIDTVVGQICGYCPFCTAERELERDTAVELSRQTRMAWSCAYANCLMPLAGGCGSSLLRGIFCKPMKQPVVVQDARL